MPIYPTKKINRALSLFSYFHIGEGLQGFGRVPSDIRELSGYFEDLPPPKKVIISHARGEKRVAFPYSI
ncbi:MAG: hypothetical protein COX52_09420 [Syntrophobacterales bacterium CG23_combo_of_CG06-09_8_20_14_all_48_27]|nr:MAG: hypothetical protein COX52_09420 [Syntrophobacterales bacterium CG23_combo_of_CG06-09_8_20_14_all_48_27]